MPFFRTSKARIFLSDLNRLVATLQAVALLGYVLNKLKCFLAISLPSFFLVVFDYLPDRLVAKRRMLPLLFPKHFKRVILRHAIASVYGWFLSCAVVRPVRQDRDRTNTRFDCRFCLFWLGLTSPLQCEPFLSLSAPPFRTSLGMVLIRDRCLCLSAESRALPEHPQKCALFQPQFFCFSHKL